MEEVVSPESYQLHELLLEQLKDCFHLTVYTRLQKVVSISTTLQPFLMSL